MNIKQAFTLLREHLGPDKVCARYVGMSPQHYEALRNGRAHIPRRTAELILLKAKEVASQEQAANNLEKHMAKPMPCNPAKT